MEKLNAFFAFSFWIVGIILIAGAALSVWLKKLTPSAAVAGAIIGYLIFYASGFSGLVMLATFFLLGSFATAFQFAKKEKTGMAESNKGQRKWTQVLANAGAAGLFGVLAILYPEYNHWFIIAIAGSFSSATADTLSSELGGLYGRKFYNITTFQKDARGSDGVISAEGCMIGLGGSILIALIYVAEYGFSNYALYIIIGGTLGNLSDSFLGATLERKGVIGNDLVNFLSTLWGALASLALCSL
jgi:uncharacterized protein (TIGR00297 family)